MKKIVFCIGEYGNNFGSIILKNYIKNNKKDNIEYIILTRQTQKKSKLIEKSNNLTIIRNKSFFVGNKFFLNFFFGFKILFYGFKSDKVFFINPDFNFGIFPIFLKKSRKIVFFDKNYFSKINLFYLEVFLCFINNIIGFSKNEFLIKRYGYKYIKVSPFLDFDRILESNNELDIKTNFGKKAGVLLNKNFVAVDVILKSFNREVLKNYNFGLIAGSNPNNQVDLNIINNDKLFYINDVDNSNISSFYKNIDMLFIIDQKLSKFEVFYQIILGIYFNKLILISEGIHYFSFLDKFENIVKINKFSSLDISTKISKNINKKFSDNKKDILNTFGMNNFLYDLQKILEK